MDAQAAKIISDVRQNKYPPVLVLQGEETFYIDLISNYIETHALTDAEKGFNQVVLYGKETPVNQILTHARRFPMMAERQVVIVREAQEIPDLQKETGSKLLLDYLARPVPSTILVLCHKHKTLDKRRELGKKVDQLAVSAVFKKPYENQLPDFIEEYVRDQGFTIDEAGIRILCEYVGNDLQRLAREIDKLVIGLMDNGVVTGERVMSQVGISREYNIFELQKAIVGKDTLLAAKIVGYFERNTKRNPVIPAVAYLFYFFSKLLAASVVIHEGEKAIVNVLKISPFSARDYINALKRYPPTRIIENISFLRQADLKLKGVDSGSITEGQILKELVFRLLY